MEHHKRVNGVKLLPEMGMFIFIFSILAPGFSTITAGFLTEDAAEKKSCIIVGIFQILLTPFFIGICWSIYNGFCIFKNSNPK